MPRLLAGAALALLSALALAGCGQVTETASLTPGGGGQVYLVITADSQAGLDAISQSWLKGSGSETATITSGDSHQGQQVCTASFQHGGHSYTVTFYANGSAAKEADPGACGTAQNEMFSS